MKRLLILPMALILVSCVTSSCSSSSSKDKAQNDSIAAAELEAARLDSLRQDSIARRNFTSPDLAFHDLHGDVKKCVCDDYATYTFDENGKWTNEPQWDESDKQFCPDRTKHPRVIRDNDGYITRIYMECDADYEYEDISWDDGKIKTRFISTYSYNDDGLVIDREDEEEYDTKESATYCNYEVDGMGNWVKRDVIVKILDTFQNTIRYEKHTETRNITYYKSKSEGHVVIPNNATQNAIQELALESSIHKKEQEDTKGPEWLQGSWELTIDSPYGVIATYYLTINGQNAHLVEGDTDKYNGRYEIRDGYIIVGPRKYYINDNYQRLDYNQYRWHKISGGNSRQVNSGRSSSFGSANDVMRYLSGRTFYNDGDGLRIDYNAVYLNGRALTGAPRVVDISGNSATVVANSPYSGGGALRFYVNSSNGTVTQNGDVYRER